jgi:hypothetical protein
MVTSQESSSFERDHAAARDNDVIEDADAEQFAGIDEPLGDRKVLFAGFGITGGMVVNVMLPTSLCGLGGFQRRGSRVKA